MSLSNKMRRAVMPILKREFNIIKEEFNFMDMFGINSTSHETIEIEIKVSDTDFYREFYDKRKVSKHEAYYEAIQNQEGFVPTRFYFCVPSHMIDRCVDYMMYRRPYYGILAYDRNTNKVRLIKKSDQLNKRKWQGELLRVPYINREHKTICMRKIC